MLHKIKDDNWVDLEEIVSVRLAPGLHKARWFILVGLRSGKEFEAETFATEDDAGRSASRLIADVNRFRRAERLRDIMGNSWIDLAEIASVRVTPASDNRWSVGVRLRCGLEFEAENFPTKLGAGAFAEGLIEDANKSRQEIKLMEVKAG